MYDYRKTTPGSQIHLQAEHLHLPLAILPVPVEVDTYLPYRHIISGMLRKFVIHISELCPGALRADFRRVMSDSHECVMRIKPVQPTHRLERGPVDIGQYHRLHSGRYGTFDSRPVVGGELIKIEMCVGINHNILPVIFFFR